MKWEKLCGFETLKAERRRYILQRYQLSCVVEITVAVLMMDPLLWDP